MVPLCNQAVERVGAAHFTLQPAERGYSTPLFSLVFMRFSVMLYVLSYNLRTNEELYFVNTISHTSLYHVSPYWTPAGWELPVLLVRMKTRDVFFFFFSIWQWSRFILTLNPSQSPESTRHISKVSRICSICFWETDAVIGYFTSLIKFSDLRHKPWNILLMGKTLSVFMISGSPWDSTMGLKEDSYIRKITNAGFILFPDLFF